MTLRPSVARFLKTLVRDLFGDGKPETAGERVFFRAFEFFVALATLHTCWAWARYTLLISDVVLPLGLARYLDVSFMFHGALPIWNAALISVAVTVGFAMRGRATGVAYAVAMCLLLLQYAARYSLGEIPHSANMLGMAFLGLTLGNLFIPAGAEARRFVLGFTYFFIGLGYTAAAWSKLIASGPLWVDGRHLWMWIHEKGIDQMAKSGLLEYNWLQQLLLDNYLLATIFLCIGLVSEFSAFLLWWRRFRMPVMLNLIALHVGIYLTMNIIFRLSMYELLLLALPWPAWIDAALASRSGSAVVNRIRYFTGTAAA